MRHGKYDLTGQKFGRLTAKAVAPRGKGGAVRWFCVCDCGSEHISSSENLRHGRSTECRSCADVRRKKKMLELGRKAREERARAKLEMAPVPAAHLRGFTSVEVQYRHMLTKGIKLHPDNGIRFANFTEVRLYDRLIQRDVDKMTQGLMG